MLQDVDSSAVARKTKRSRRRTSSTTTTKTHVFVSYCRDDARIVSIMVDVIKVGRPTIFRDVDSIGPGDKWRPTITDAIATCDVFVLFWCRHARASTAVRSEWRQALRAGKRIVPILVDRTPLPTPLAEYQWIDVRELMELHGFRHPGGVVVHRLMEPTHHLAGMTIRRELWRILYQDNDNSTHGP